ncbi:SAM-dependent methyltransferase [Agromyces arachidis]|uniref:SAM-dependent methyltransferase n=1 Tax=Agromyces arachidis TaxID=766966 RepID=UPI00405772FB
MEDCCGPTESQLYDRAFDSRFARRVARRYRSGGPTAIERRLLAILEQAGISGASVLEIGGGVGELQLELLARGAARTTNLELSHAYEAEATRLMEDAGVRDRVTRVVGADLARTHDAVDAADLVILNRVVCCYPEAPELLAAAAGRARHALAFSYPPRNLVTRARVAFDNAINRVARREYRAYVHDPERMAEAVRSAGLEIVVRDAGFSWCVMGARRPS